MGIDYIKEQLVDILSKEFQSIWLIKVEDLTMETFSSDIYADIPNSVETALKLNSYEIARKWYIEQFVVEQSKARLLEQTRIENVLNELKDKKTFFVEYGRNNKVEINYNQLCYGQILNPESQKIEYITLGFRSVDIAKKSEIDDLTGLLTRTFFFKTAENMLKEFPDEQFDLVISDIIDFKKINETYGADVADRILKWHGGYLSQLIDDKMIVGRYGGDQMAIFGPHDKIMYCLSEPCREIFIEEEKNNGLPSIVIKYGIYLNVKHDRSILATCDKAHMALNSIKHHYSKDVAFYNDEIRYQLDKQRKIEESMHESLENGDFKVYYQPKHNAKTGEIVGAEALIRWFHHEYGFMSPADFIPLFEKNGFIVENDKFVWSRTCENLRRWQDRGINTVPISINGSKLTMENEGFVNFMKEEADKYSLSTDQLHLEITETLMENNTLEMIEKLNKIRSMGFKVELDDFGSGYSSLNALSEFPIDVVKLDMSFMKQFGDEKHLMVLESCIDLAKKMGFETVSEGVEEKEQLELLAKLGADAIQGYYYSKPLPENEFEIYLLQHSS